MSSKEGVATALETKVVYDLWTISRSWPIGFALIVSLHWSVKAISEVKERIDEHECKRLTEGPSAI